MKRQKKSFVWFVLLFLLSSNLYSQTASIEEVKDEICYHCGVSVDMDYG